LTAAVALTMLRRMSQLRMAVIGAGAAGLACAHELARADVQVTVYDRARSIGGRLATRRHGDCAFDHGAQFVTARGRPFASYAELALRSGALGVWRPAIMQDDTVWPSPVEEWWVGTPGMSAFLRPLARHLDVRTGIAVQELIPGRRGWELQTDAGRSDDVFKAVAVAIPAPQAAHLLGTHGAGFREVADVTMAPCWTVLAAFDPPIDAGADARRWTRGPLVWAACNSTKPDRLQRPQCWVLHASASWSREHVELESQEVVRELLAGLAQGLRRHLPPPTYATAHRWRHALVDRPLGLPHVFDEELSLGACGDWCLAPRVEAAFDSGRSLGQSLLSAVGLATRPLRA
jgi:renalase